VLSETGTGKTLIFLRSLRDFDPLYEIFSPYDARAVRSRSDIGVLPEEVQPCPTSR